MNQPGKINTEQTANKAEIRIAFLGGLEITAKPIAAIAAKIPSSNTDNTKSQFIAYPILKLIMLPTTPMQYKL